MKINVAIKNHLLIYYFMDSGRLSHLVKPKDSLPCLVWPVVESKGGLLLPNSNERKIVSSFTKIDTIEKFDVNIGVPDSSVIIKKGEPTLFAYAVSPKEYYHGTLEEFSAQINELLKAEKLAVPNDAFKQIALYIRVGAKERAQGVLTGLQESEDVSASIKMWAKNKLREL